MCCASCDIQVQVYYICKFIQKETPEKNGTQLGIGPSDYLLPTALLELLSRGAVDRLYGPSHFQTVILSRYYSSLFKCATPEPSISLLLPYSAAVKNLDCPRLLVLHVSTDVICCNVVVTLGWKCCVDRHEIRHSSVAKPVAGVVEQGVDA